MKKRRSESVKLGFFVLTGLLVLVVTLYVIGKNKGMFSNSFELKTNFRSVNGLMAGNNVRYGGIDVGTVKSVELLNDTVIEVTINVATRMHNIIRSNAITSLGTDGLIGNRVINISPARGEAPMAKEGDLLSSREEVSTDAMLQTLHVTNENVAAISEELRATVHHINTSALLTQLLDDEHMTGELKAALTHLHEASAKASTLMTEASQTLALASKGNGMVATLLTDTSMSHEVEQAIHKIKAVEDSAERLTHDLNQVVTSVDKDFIQGKGTVYTLMNDTAMVARLQNTIVNVEQGTAAFNQNMEALKHNFLLRKYFKKQERKNKQ